MTKKECEIPESLKSDNLQYNTLGRQDERLIDQVSDVPSIIFFFIISCKILCENCFNLFSYKFTKIKRKSFECPKSMRNYRKNNAWNIRHLVDKSFVLANQRIILSDFKIQCSTVKSILEQNLKPSKVCKICYLTRLCGEHK